MENKNTEAFWDISLNCDCPHCGEYFDIINDTYDFWDGRNLEVGEHGTENSKGIEVTCPHCHLEFKVDLFY